MSDSGFADQIESRKVSVFSCLSVIEGSSLMPTKLFNSKLIILDCFLKKTKMGDTWVAQLVKPLPSAQGVIAGSWDRVPHQAPSSVGSLLLSLPLPATLPA